MTVGKNDIDGFFTNIKTVLSDSEQECLPQSISPTLERSVNDKPGEQRTNVIYLNTNCNLRCEYCYEGDSREGLPDQADCSPEIIDNFLDEICKRESGLTSTVVIMGGEPFLRFDLVQYVVYRAIELNKPGGWGFSLITNATFLTDKKIIELKKLLDLSLKFNAHISFEVSYDASGQFRRKWPNGSNSKEIVEAAIDRLVKHQVYFKLSYTCHAGNYMNLVDDCIYIFERWPLPYHTRMTVGYAYTDLDKVLGQGGAQKVKKEFIPKAIELFKKYKIPICGNTCGYCKICEKGNFVGNSYLSPTTGITYAKKLTGAEFKQF